MKKDHGESHNATNRNTALKGYCPSVHYDSRSHGLDGVSTLTDHVTTRKTGRIGHGTLRKANVGEVKRTTTWKSGDKRTTWNTGFDLGRTYE